MTFFAKIRMFLPALLLAAATTAHADPVRPTYTIPRLPADATIDVVEKSGFRVGIMADERGKVPPAETFSPTLHLAWTPDHLLALAVVRDTTPHEAPGTDGLWRQDSVELFLARTQSAKAPSPPDAAVIANPDWVYQVVIAPGGRGAEPPSKTARTFFNDRRAKTNQTVPLACDVTVHHRGDTYAMLARLPWKNLGIDKPETGARYAFQAYVNDAPAANAGRRQVLFYPVPGAHNDADLTCILALAEQAGPPVRMVASAEYERFRRIRLNVIGERDLVGKALSYHDTRDAAGSFRGYQGRAVAALSLPLPTAPTRPLAVDCEGVATAFTPPLPSIDEARARALAFQDVAFSPSVFAGEAFPEPRMHNEHLVDLLVGPYTLTTRYFDADAQEVVRAEKPGRYGAVVTIRVDDQPVTRRFVTLYRMPEGFSFWGADFSPTLKLPPEIIEPRKSQRHNRSLADFLNREVSESIWHPSGFPALLAGMHDSERGNFQVDFYQQAFNRDRDYWVKVRRKLLLLEQPIEIEVLLREKSGPRPFPDTDPGEFAQRLDQYCRDWYADSRQPFNVAIAHRGKILFQRAYGEKSEPGGKPVPVTTETRFEVASITKLYASIAMMMLVDRGHVKLDDPISDHLPMFKDQVSKRTTVRMLYTHTAGYGGHLGEDWNDLEERLVNLAPLLTPGKRHDYNGTSIALGSRIIELKTGMSIGTFYQQHLFRPMGLVTEAATSTYGSKASANELLVIGHMLLAGGSYSSAGIMKPESVKAMYPQKLTDILGHDTRAEWGIGLTWRDRERTFLGHGAASNATLWFDPEVKLVIAMARDAAGKDWNKWHDGFIKLIREGTK